MTHFSGRSPTRMTILLMLLLLATPIRVFAHGGHGNEFQSGSQATSAADAIQVDAAIGFEG